MGNDGKITSRSIAIDSSANYPWTRTAAKTFAEKELLPRLESTGLLDSFECPAGFDKTLWASANVWLNEANAPLNYAYLLSCKKNGSHPEFAAQSLALVSCTVEEKILEPFNREYEVDRGSCEWMFEANRTGPVFDK